MKALTKTLAPLVLLGAALWLWLGSGGSPVLV